MSDKKKLKNLPHLNTDKQAVEFVESADLSEYDLSGFRLVNFEFENKSATISMRLPESQLAAVKAAAKKRGMPYQRFMREMIQRGMQDLQSR